MSGTRYFFRLKEIIEANILIFARKRSEVRKTRCFMEYVKGFLKIAKCMQGEMMMNGNTKPADISFMWGCVCASFSCFHLSGSCCPMTSPSTAIFSIVLSKPGDMSESRGKFQSGFFLPQTSEWESLHQGPRYLHFHRMLPGSFKTDWSWETLCLRNKMADNKRNK